MNTLFFIMIALPLVSALVLLAARTISQETARQFSLAATVVTLAATLAFAYRFMQLPDETRTSPVEARYSVSYTWFSLGEATAEPSGAEPLRFAFHFGMDGIGLVLVVLTALLTFSCVLISWDSIRERASGFYACLLLLETGLIGVFSSFDLVLFYVFFEFTLVPLFFMIGIWGGPQRRYAAIKFFVYTFAGSIVTLVGLVALVLTAAAAGVTMPTSITELASWAATPTGDGAHPIADRLQVALFLAIAVGFMVKVPLFPLHTWLPLAHVEAPTAGSVLLAGVLLKLGTFGFLRLCLPLFPYACRHVGIPLMATLAVAGIIYGSLCALAQRDIKKLVAYSSVAHLGFCMLGLFALNAAGISGGVLQMVNHGLSTGGLFLLVGMIYDRYHTRMLDDLGGLAARLPLVASAMVFISMASIGLPGLNGFVGEVLSLLGMFRERPLFAILGTSGVVLGAWYMLSMLQQAFFGPLKEPGVGEGGHGEHGHGHPMRDMNVREMLAIGPICALCLWIGVMPQPLINTIKPDVDAVAAIYEAQAPAPAQARVVSTHIAPGALNMAASTVYPQTLQSENSTLN